MRSERLLTNMASHDTTGQLLLWPPDEQKKICNFINGCDGLEGGGAVP